jgi:hypothetical protein
VLAAEKRLKVCIEALRTGKFKRDSHSERCKEILKGGSNMIGARPKPIDSPRSLNDRKIVYLACPYTHPDKKVREERFQAATRAAAQLINMGLIVFSPITMTHPLDVVMGGGTETLGSEYWVAFDEAFMDFCSEMLVLQIAGWDESEGIRREIEYFRARGKPVRFLDSDYALTLATKQNIP